MIRGVQYIYLLKLNKTHFVLYWKCKYTMYSREITFSYYFFQMISYFFELSSYLIYLMKSLNSGNHTSVLILVGGSKHIKKIICVSNIFQSTLIKGNPHSSIVFYWLLLLRICIWKST